MHNLIFNSFVVLKFKFFRKNNLYNIFLAVIVGYFSRFVVVEIERNETD
jgi:hypothetical protein